MELQEAIKKVFLQVTDVLDQLTDEQYKVKSNVLLNASIGEHVRHILELFIELDKGYSIGVVNYDERKRDRRIETDRQFAAMIAGTILSNLHKEEKDLQLEVNCSTDVKSSIIVTTNYTRELIYNLEHAIHHMALIRIGVNAVSVISVPENFGIATSTIKHRAACAQ